MFSRELEGDELMMVVRSARCRQLFVPDCVIARITRHIVALLSGVPLISLLWKAGLLKQAIGSEHWSLPAVVKMLFPMPYRFRREFGVSAYYAAWGAIAALLVGLPLAI